MSLRPCQRCHTLTDTLSEGSVRLCPACPRGEHCGEYQHNYRAAHKDLLGTWVCLTCGGLLHSQPISLAPVTGSTG